MTKLMRRMQQQTLARVDRAQGPDALTGKSDPRGRVPPAVDHQVLTDNSSDVAPGTAVRKAENLNRKDHS